MRVRPLALLLPMLLLSACAAANGDQVSSPSSSTPSASSQSPTEPAAPSQDRENAAFVREPAGSSRAALLAGVLNVDDATGCLWLDAGGQRHQVLLKGETLRLDFTADSPVIRDGDAVVAAAGERMELQGGFTDVPGVPGCPVGGQVWIGALPPSAKG